MREREREKKITEYIQKVFLERIYMEYLYIYIEYAENRTVFEKSECREAPVVWAHDPEREKEIFELGLSLRDVQKQQRDVTTITTWMSHGNMFVAKPDTNTHLVEIFAKVLQMYYTFKS